MNGLLHIIEIKSNLGRIIFMQINVIISPYFAAESLRIIAFKLLRIQMDCNFCEAFLEVEVEQKNQSLILQTDSQQLQPIWIFNNLAMIIRSHATTEHGKIIRFILLNSTPLKLLSISVINNIPFIAIQFNCNNLIFPPIRAP